MNYSPDGNNAQATRAVSLHKEIRIHFPDTFLMMKEGDKPCVEKDYYLLRPLIPSEGKYRSIRTLKGIISRIHMTIVIFQFVRQKEITSVILRGFDTTLLFPLLKLKKVKIFYDFHGRYNLELLQLKRYILAAFVKFCDIIILNLADGILVVSEGIQSQIPEYRHKCLLIENGIDLQMIEEAKNREPPIDLAVDKYIVGFIGNWEQVMMIDDICNAVDFLDDTISLIIGKGYDAERIFLNYNDGVKHIFTGQINQIDALNLLYQMDVCVIPYDKDYYMSKLKYFFSNRKIYEYLAAGKPIIVSNIEGKPGFLIEKTNCLVYESRNPKDLAEKISILKNNPSITQEMGNNNKELAKKFTWKNIIENSGILNELT